MNKPARNKSRDLTPSGRCCSYVAIIPVRIVEWDPTWPPQSEVPHAGTKWMDGIYRVTVDNGIPIRRSLYGWCVSVTYSDGSTGLAPINTLKPIPQTASGEVMGMVTIKEDSCVGYVSLPPGTYTIIKPE